MRSFLAFITTLIILAGACYGFPTRIDDNDEYRISNSTGLNSTVDSNSTDSTLNSTDSLNSTDTVNSTTLEPPKSNNGTVTSATATVSAVVSGELNGTVNVTVSKNGTVCPNGWIVYESSCYYVGRTTKSFQQANVYCQSLGGALITIDTPDEWETMRNHMRPIQWTWIGLTGQGSLLAPAWITPGSSFNPESLPWLVASSGHGSTALVNCVAYYSSTDSANSYVNFYDCGLKYYYICENNATVTGKSYGIGNARHPITTTRLFKNSKSSRTVDAL